MAGESISIPSIDSIEFPRPRERDEFYDMDYNKACAYDNYLDDIKKRGMDKCAKIYEDLQAALYTVGAYMISYGRALESANYSCNQIREAYFSLKEITDDNKRKIERTIEKYLDDNSKIIPILNEKLYDLRVLYDNLNSLSAKVVEVNNKLDNFF
jgi:hypothetical protein